MPPFGVGKSWSLIAPPITLPKRVEPDAKGGMNITVDPDSLKTPAGPVWMLYPAQAGIWKDKKFKAAYPKGEMIGKPSEGPFNYVFETANGHFMSFTLLSSAACLVGAKRSRL